MVAWNAVLAVIAGVRDAVFNHAAAPPTDADLVAVEFLSVAPGVEPQLWHADGPLPCVNVMVPLSDAFVPTEIASTPLAFKLPPLPTAAGVHALPSPPTVATTTSSAVCRAAPKLLAENEVFVFHSQVPHRGPGNRNGNSRRVGMFLARSLCPGATPSGEVIFHDNLAHGHARKKRRL
jgi:hypothetical protein